MAEKKTVYYVGPVGWGRYPEPHNSYEEAANALEEWQKRTGIYDHTKEIIKVEVEGEQKKVVR